MRFVAAALVLASAIQAPPPKVLIFAASSLKTSIDAMADPIRHATGVTINVSYASSAVLARQIEDGAPADLFISADTDWMDYVAQRGLIDRTSRVNIAGNSLVLIAPADHTISLSVKPGFALAAALGNGRLAIGDPASVPAGKYAKAALTSLGVWTSVEKKLLPAENVRAALTLVSRAEAPLGIVYATDALADPSVVVVGTFPANSHAPIVYPGAVVVRKGARSGGAAHVLAYFKSGAGSAMLRRFGFTTPSH